MKTTPRHYAKVTDACGMDLKPGQHILLGDGTDLEDYVRVSKVGQPVTANGKHMVEIGYTHPNADGNAIVKGWTVLDAFKRYDVVQLIEVGMPATIHLVSDSMAAVITKVNAKSVRVARVETGEARRDPNREGELPVMVAYGVTSKRIGPDENYGLRFYGRQGIVGIGTGSIRVSVGKSVSVTDYRH